MPDRPSPRALSVVMPLYNARHWTPRVLPPLQAARDAGEIEDVIVVDDGSTDGSAEDYRAAGFTVLESGGRLGPAACRNLGVQATTSPLVLFLDSDVVMSPPVPGQMRSVFAEQDCVAVFGSYDDEPGSPGVISQYRNLLHHFVHQNGQEEASTFWAGCGAVDREAFLAVGGFDGDRYPRPCIEDIELGYRLRLRGGRILLRPEILVKHLKRWTLSSMISTDVFQRAIPWSRMMMEPDYQVSDLNVSGAERGKALVALSIWGFAAAAVIWPIAAVGIGLALIVAFAVNASFFALVWRKRGLFTTVAAVLLQQLYYTYSVLSYVYCILESKLKPRK